MHDDRVAVEFEEDPVVEALRYPLPPADGRTTIQHIGVVGVLSGLVFGIILAWAVIVVPLLWLAWLYPVYWPYDLLLTLLIGLFVVGGFGFLGLMVGRGSVLGGRFSGLWFGVAFGLTFSVLFDVMLLVLGVLLLHFAIASVGLLDFLLLFAVLGAIAGGCSGAVTSGLFAPSGERRVLPAGWFGACFGAAFSLGGAVWLAVLVR
jgi:hypothetical protein